MRRRRPAAAPPPEHSSPVVPLARAHLVRGDSEDGGTAGATALDLRGGTRSRFGELTPTIAPAAVPPGAGRQQRPTAARPPARARRAKAAPEAHDGWTFVLIPPGADARPRTLRVSVRRLRFILVSASVVFGSTALTGGLLVLALSVLPPAQDEVRGVELGVFASAVDARPDFGRLDTAITPAGIAAASAGAAAPRATPRPRPAAPRPRPTGGPDLSPSIMESLPVVGEITSRFARARRHPLLGVVRKHAGVDIAAPAGTHITAPAAGRVTFSGKRFGYGYTVEIDHGNGIITRYAHCRSLMVRAGDEVADGAVIATVGRSGLATAPHLHYEILVRGRSVDPLHTSLTALLAGEQPPSTSASPQPADSALREAVIPDAISAPDPDMPDLPDVLELPEIPPAAREPIVSPPITAPIITNTSSITTMSLSAPGGVPPAAAQDTARKS